MDIYIVLATIVCSLLLLGVITLVLSIVLKPEWRYWDQLYLYIFITAAAVTVFGWFLKGCSGGL